MGSSIGVAQAQVTFGSMTNSFVAEALTAQRTWIAVSAGQDAACALDAGGAVYCWGIPPGINGVFAPTNLRNCRSQSCFTRAEPMLGAMTFNAIAISDNHACVLAGTAAWCWGSNSKGQLGTGNMTQPPDFAPRQVTGGVQFSSIRAGHEFTCAVSTTSNAYCWGTGAQSQRGWASDSSAPAPASPSQLVRIATSVNSGLPSYPHVCGLRADSTAECWGYDIYGELGDSTWSACQPYHCRTSGQQIQGSHKYIAIGAGGGGSCASTAGGQLYCWGMEYFLAGAPPTLACPGNPCVTFPILASGAPAFTSLEGGTTGMCGLTAIGTAYCWGSGITPLSRPYPPYLVSSTLRFTAVTVGTSHECGLTAGGRIYCWGSNAFGALGDDSGDRNTYTPVRVINR